MKRSWKEIEGWFISEMLRNRGVVRKGETKGGWWWLRVERRKAHSLTIDKVDCQDCLTKHRALKYVPRGHCSYCREGKRGGEAWSIQEAIEGI